MEFWGVEVKPKESVKCAAEPDILIHLSQASLGEIKKDKRTESVPLFVKINDQKLVLGTLSPENCTQIQYDLVFEKEFELSHGSKDTSVFFVGYKSIHQDHGSDDDFSDSDSDEGIQIGSKVTEKAVKSNEGKPTAGKAVIGAAIAKPQSGKPDKVKKPKSDGFLNKNDDDEESEDDEELLKGTIDSDDDDDDDEDEEDSSEDEDANLKKVGANLKKRSAAGVLKPTESKKAKVSTPIGKQKTGDSKKDSKAAATPAAKQAGKSPATGDKAKQQSAKSIGSFKCNPCNKPFNSDSALQAHNNAKHSAAK